MNSSFYRGSRRRKVQTWHLPYVVFFGCCPLVSKFLPWWLTATTNFAIYILMVWLKKLSHLTNFCPCHGPPGKVMKPKFRQACHGHWGCRFDWNPTVVLTKVLGSCERNVGNVGIILCIHFVTVGALRCIFFKDLTYGLRAYTVCCIINRSCCFCKTCTTLFKPKMEIQPLLQSFN